MLHRLKDHAAGGAGVAAACLMLAACAGRTLSDPPLPPPPPPPARPAIAWTPRTAPSPPARPAPTPLAGRSRLTVGGPPPPAPVFHDLALEPVPDVVPPRSFCSIDEKYAFIDQRQLPAYDAAMRNSAAANAYKAHLADLYVQYRDASAGGVHSGEVMAQLKRAGPIADAAFDKAAAMQRLFDTVLAVPVKGRCKR